MGKKILIVDDSSTLRASVEFTLQEHGLEVIQASDGDEALKMLKSLAGSEKEIGVIITDVNMPNLDGISFIKEVKKTSFKFIPILIMTTESEDNKKTEGKEAGAAGWLIKPFKPDQLVDVVAKFVR